MAELLELEVKETAKDIKRVRTTISLLFVFVLAIGLKAIFFITSLTKEGIVKNRILLIIPIIITIIILIFLLMTFKDFLNNINFDIKNEKMKAIAISKFKAKIGGYTPIVCKNKNSIANRFDFGNEEIDFTLHLISKDKMEIIMKSKSKTQIFTTGNFLFLNDNFIPKA